MINNNNTTIHDKMDYNKIINTFKDEFIKGITEILKSSGMDSDEKLLFTSDDDYNFSITSYIGIDQVLEELLQLGYIDSYENNTIEEVASIRIVDDEHLALILLMIVPTEYSDKYFSKYKSLNKIVEVLNTIVLRNTKISIIDKKYPIMLNITNTTENYKDELESLCNKLVLNRVVDEIIYNLKDNSLDVELTFLKSGLLNLRMIIKSILEEYLM